MFFVRVAARGGNVLLLVMPEDWFDEDLRRLDATTQSRALEWTRLPRNRETDLTLASMILDDGTIHRLGEEEFRIHLAPNRSESSVFPAPAGTHTLSARITGFGGKPTPNGFAWPDTTVTLSAGQHLVRTIDLYCS